MKAIEEEWPQDQIQRRKLEKILPMFRKDGERLLEYTKLSIVVDYYNVELCIARKSVSDVLQLVHDSKISGHFKFAKTLSRLSNFHWRHKSQDVRKYVEGCMKCQQFKDSNQKKLAHTESLEIPEEDGAQYQQTLS